MPNVNALKKFVKKKVNRSDLTNNVKASAKKKINRLKIKQRTEKFMAEQKLYNKLSQINGNFRNNVVFSPVTQRLLTVKPISRSVKKSIKKASPTTSRRTARRQSAKAGAVVLSRRGIPRGPAQNIIERLLRR
tara:strand:+ start:4712 stop:5110 length:399 start_codon:yes stop_codon:yes gene_type:complete